MRIARLFALALALPLFAQAPPTARIDLIGAEIFSIDRSHSSFGFTVSFFGMSKVRGTFKDYAATILYDDAHPERSSVTLSIDAASIDTGDSGRDRDLQGDAWFASAKHPRIVFQSTRIEPKGANQYLVHGELSMKGVTRAIAIPMTRTVARVADAGWGNIRIGGSGSVTLKRRDFGIDGPDFWNKAIGEEVVIELDILGTRPNYDRWNLPEEEKGQLTVKILRHMQHRELQEALALLQTAVERYPEAASFHLRLGEAYAALGDRAAAIRSYEKAQALFPISTEAMEMLRRLRPAR
ncbi:MAG TPA: YceI family protein [Thermoanaerobaculia bacterium]|nr:YceI family protein [Thermoanaerobaculia bacterium]